VIHPTASNQPADYISKKSDAWLTPIEPIIFLLR
jgi:hypothetical protein